MWTKVLGIREDEVSGVLALFYATFSLGIGGSLFYASSNALFLSEYSTDLLPHAYIVNALVVVVFGSLYSVFEKRVSFLSMIYGMVAVFAVTTFLLWVGIVLTGSPFLKFLAFIWYRVFFMFTSIGFWEIAARLLNIQQAKRLFTVLAVGIMVAAIIGGLATSPLVVW
jgi:ATP:ADP antiporter, AAA family